MRFRNSQLVSSAENLFETRNYLCLNKVGNKYYTEKKMLLNQQHLFPKARISGLKSIYYTL